MPFLPGRIYRGRPILDIHSRQSDRVARVDRNGQLRCRPLSYRSNDLLRGAPHITPPKSVSSALRWQITQKCLRLPLLQCLLPPNQVGPLLLDPGQLQISRLTPLQKMNYIQIKCKIHQKRKHYNTHSLRAPFFFLRAYGGLNSAAISAHRTAQARAEWDWAALNRMEPVMVAGVCESVQSDGFVIPTTLGILLIKI